MRTSDWTVTFPHFSPEEYFSPDGMSLFNRNIIPCDLTILHSLEHLRYSLNLAREEGDVVSDSEVGIVINHGGEVLRGFVSPGEWVNMRSKRADQIFSFHLWCAADIHSSQISANDLYNFITGHLLMSGKYTSRALFNGVIKYPWGVHVDLRQSTLFLDIRE